MNPSAIIVDLDGTLCNSSKRSHHLRQEPKNWDAFYGSMHEDDIMPAVELIIKSIYLRHPDMNILYVTGRDEQYRTVTWDWLNRHNLHGALFMRSNGDRRHDDIVKREIYENVIRYHYEVVFVLEDRSRVVKMWRSLGLTCLQVAEGDF